MDKRDPPEAVIPIRVVQRESHTAAAIAAASALADVQARAHTEGLSAILALAEARQPRNERTWVDYPDRLIGEVVAIGRSCGLGSMRIEQADYGWSISWSKPVPWHASVPQETVEMALRAELARLRDANRG